MFINLVKACSAIVAGSPAVSCNLDYVIFIDIHYSDADTRVRLACFRVSGVSEQRLESIGWSAITVWECELGKSSIENTMEKIESMLADFRRIVGRPHAFALRFAPMHHAHRHSLGKTAFQDGRTFACTVRQGCGVRILEGED